VVLSRQTLHFKFINQLSAVVAELNMPREHEYSAYNFHSDLILSGFERIIMVSRPPILSILPSAPIAPPTPTVYVIFSLSARKLTSVAARTPH